MKTMMLWTRATRLRAGDVEPVITTTMRDREQLGPSRLAVADRATLA